MNVVVLEARDRIGGRTYTANATNSKGTTFPVDLGASWIHGIDKNPLVPLAKAANVPLASKTTNYDNGRLFNDNGKEVNDAQWKVIDGTYRDFEDFLSDQQDAHEDSDNDPGLQSVVDAFIKQKKLSGSNLNAFKYSLDTSIQHEYGGAISDLSLWFDDDSELDGGDKLVVGGYQNIAAYLARGVDIKLNSEVTSVDYSSPSAVNVKTKDGQTYTAKNVIVTLPIGVLKANKVTFNPPLPQSKTDAVDNLGSGLLDKTVLVFPKAFWGTQIEFIERISANGSGAFEEWLSLYPATCQAVLFGFNAATYAASLEKLSDDQIKAKAMGYLRTIWPRAPDPIQVLVTRWSQDPYAYGSYSYTTPRELFAPAHKAFSTPVGMNNQVLFAGEHTHAKYPATVHGAYYSGQDAACVLVDC